MSESIPSRAPLSRLRNWCRRPALALAVAGVSVLMLSAVALKWQTRPAYLDLTVTPPDAAVTLDGRPLSLADGWSLIAESPGRHHLTIRAAGHEPQEKVVDLVRGRDNTVRANVRLQSRFGRLHAVSTPEGAGVEVRNGKGRVVARGTTPFYSPPLPQGDYSLRFIKDLFLAEQVRATVPADERMAEVPPVLLRLADGAEDSLRALAWMRAGWDSWKGATLHDDPSVTLGNVLNAVAKRHGMAISMNVRAFQAEGMEEDKVLAMPLFEKRLDLGPNAKKLSLRTVLERMLERVPTTSGAMFVPKKLADHSYGLELTTGAGMVHEPVIVLHPARDLVTGLRALSGPQLAAAVQAQLPFWTDPSPYLWHGREYAEQLPLPPVSIRYLAVSGALQVTHNWRIQEDVHDFLNQLRQARSARGVLPLVLQPLGDLTESNRLLACMRASQTPWKGNTCYDDPSVTLSEFLNVVAKLHGVEISINAVAFEAVGLEVDKLCSAPLCEKKLDLGPNAKRLSLQTVLRCVLQRVPVPGGITIVPRKMGKHHYVWELTTGQFMLDNQLTMLHSVGDLIAGSQSAEQLVRAVRAQLPFWESRNPITGETLDPEEQQPRREIPVQFLPVGKVLRVTHNWWIQEEVHNFLNQLRQTRRTRGIVPALLRPADTVTESSRLLACMRASWQTWKGPREVEGSLSLRQFLRLVGRHHGVAIVLNEQAFEADCTGILDQAIGTGKMSLNPKWSARAVLLNVVRQLGIPGGAALLPRKLSEQTYGWEITTRAAAETEPFTVLHPAGDLLSGPGGLSTRQLMAAVRGQLPLRERAVASVEFSPLGKAVLVSYNWRLQERVDGYLNQLRQMQRQKKGGP